MRRLRLQYQQPLGSEDGVDFGFVFLTSIAMTVLELTHLRWRWRQGLLEPPDPEASHEAYRRN